MTLMQFCGAKCPRCGNTFVDEISMSVCELYKHHTGKHLCSQCGVYFSRGCS